MKAFADYNDYEIAGTYENAGKSGKSIEGRMEFNRMMEDIKSGRDGVSYVLVLDYPDLAGMRLMYFLFTDHAGFWRKPDLCGGRF